MWSDGASAALFRPRVSAVVGLSSVLVAFLVLGCAPRRTVTVSAAAPTTTAAKIVAGARDQLTWGTTYDSAYRRLTYPGGDVPRDKGVCTDVIVRALRAAGHDLQKLIHEDMKKSWRSYPRYGGLSKPDRNIDHRRVPNQMAYMRRHATKLPLDGDWKRGDFVYWKLDSGLDHCGVLTDKLNSSGEPYVIHNLSTPSEEDCLRSWKIIGHYRWKK